MRISDWSSDVCSSDLLHAMDGQIAVTHAHDEAVGAGRVHHQRIRQAFRLDDQRVIARRGEGRGKSREYAGCLMADLAGLAVHTLRPAEHLAAEGLSYGRITKSNAHQRALFGRASR